MGKRVYGRTAKTATEKTRGLRGQLARVIDELPDGAPRVRVDAGPDEVAEALTRVEDWLEMHVRHGVWRDTRTVRSIRRQYETAVWP